MTAVALHAYSVRSRPRATQTCLQNPLAKRGTGTERCADGIDPDHVPKKSKTEDTNTSIPAETVTSTTAADPAVEATKSGAKKAGGKKAPAAKKTSSKTAAKKTAAKKSSKKPPRGKSAPAKRSAEPSDEEIRIRAYFIAERRLQLSLDGDPANDWIQARQELIAERGNGAASGNGSH